MINLDVRKVREELKKGNLPSELEVSQLCANAKELLVEEPNLIYANCPVTIVGSVHGQFEDLMNIFKLNGECPQQNYLFMGGYVNRGYKGLETFLYLLTLKVQYADRLTLLRGNHESREITQSYGFYDECFKKYGSLNVWRDFTDVFECLPLAAHIDNKAFAVSGGLSPEIASLIDIQKIDRKRDIPNTGPLCNLLWSDPSEEDGWGINSRGQGFTFGEEEFNIFMGFNKLEKMFRSHQMLMEGFKKEFGDRLVTIWSAPNYCGRCGNTGAFLNLDADMNEKFVTFEECSEKTEIIQPEISFTSFFGAK